MYCEQAAHRWRQRYLQEEGDVRHVVVALLGVPQRLQHVAVVAVVMPHPPVVVCLATAATLAHRT